MVMFGRDLSIFCIDLEPLFETGLRVRFDCVNRAFWFANAAIDAFVGVNDEHVLALIEADAQDTPRHSPLTCSERSSH